jgi:hypothetical protein
MAKKVEVEIDVKTEASVARLRELRKQLKQTAAGSADFNKLSADIRDVEDALEGAKLGAEDLAGALEAAPGPVGQLFQGLKKVEIATKSWGTALKATGIGLVVAAVGGLVAAFTQTEGAMKKLEPLLIGLEKILGGIFEAFQPVLDAFLEMALKALPYITDGIGAFYSVIFGLFKLIKDVGVGAGKILKGIFTFDFDALKEGYESIKNAIPNAIDAGLNAFGRFEAGTKKLTKTQKENLKELSDLEKQRLDEKIKNLEAEGKYEEALLAKKKAIDMEDEFSEEQKLFTNKKYADELFELQKSALEKKLGLYKKDSVEYKALQTELTNLDANKITQTTEFNNQLKAIREKNAKEEIDFEVKLAADLQKIEDKKLEDKLKNDAIEKGEYDARYARLAAGVANDLDLQRQLLEEKKAADDKYYAEQLAAEGLTADQIRLLNERKLADEKFYTEKSIELERARIAVKQKALDDIIFIAGAETGVGRAALVAKQLLAAKELINEVKRTITFSTQAAARSAVAVAEGTANTAKIGFPQNIPMLIGYAAQAFGIISAIRSAVSSAKQSVGGGGAGVSVPSMNLPAPTFGGSTSLATPQIQTGGGMNPTQQIGETLTQSQRPIRAYVVSQDISSQQALDRRTNVAATFG